MSKKQIETLNAHPAHLKPRYFLAAAAVSGCLCVVGLRHNYSHMVHLRDAVYAADKNNGDTKTALQNLQLYVTHHMNTELTVTNGPYPPIQLQYTYDRLVRAQSEKLAKESTRGFQIYTDATNYCAAHGSQDNLACIRNYITAHGSDILKNFQPIPDSLYKFDFASPRWSPDLAGWSLLAIILFLLIFIVSLLVTHLLKKKNHSR